MTLKTKYIIGILLISLLGTLALGWYIGHKRSNNAAQSTINGLTEQIKRDSVVINNKQLYIASVEQEILTQGEAIRQGEITREELRKLNIKKVNEVAFLRGQIKIMKDSIAHTGNIIIVTPCDSIGESRPAIELPFTFRDSTVHYDIMGGFNSMGRMSIDLTVPMSIDVWFGLDRDTKEYKAVVTTDNPVVNFTEIRSLKLDLPREKRYGIGLFGGYGISLNPTVRKSFIVGVGVTYSFIRF